jgi:mRNA-degrading endonuclease RelE of RelBE toxin-antitoxin system
MNNVRITKSAEKKMKEIYKINKKTYLEIFEILEKLAEIDAMRESDLIGLNIAKLKKGILTKEGVIHENLYSCRVSQSLRMIFTFSPEDNEVNVLEFVDYSKTRG